MYESMNSKYNPEINFIFMLSQFSVGLTMQSIKHIINEDESINYGNWETLLNISIIDDL